MSRPRRWTDLAPGVLALVALAAVATAVLLFARVGTIHGRKFRLFATVPEASGLSTGSEVWVAGRRVGVVDGIDYLPPTSDTTQRLLLTLHLLETVRPVIRRGATVGVHPGGNLIGAPVVTIALGLPGQPLVAPDDTLHAAPETDMDRVRTQFEDASTEVPAIMANVRVLAAQLRATQSTLGAFGIDGGATVSRAAGTAHRFVANVRSPRGTVGRLLAGGPAARFAREAIARADSVRLLVTGPSSRHSLGRFRRDSTLFREIEAIRGDLTVATNELAGTAGTAGRLQHDEALEQELARSRTALTALLSDLKRHPLRYLAF